MNNIQNYGIGLEAEGFIMDSSGKPISRIDGLPASAWVLEQLKKSSEQLIAQVGLELASVFLEVRTGVHTNASSAVHEVLEIRAELDRLLGEKGARLIFTPVSTQAFEFVASTEDANSRAAELVALWGQSADGTANLLASSIASLQVNDSRPFQGINNDATRLEMARRIHNHCSGSLIQVMHAYTSDVMDFRGQTRLQNYREIVMRVEAEKFRNAGFEPHDAVIPPHFHDVAAMQKWMCAYSGVTDVADTKAKDEHALTCKIKRHPWIVEVRYPDAVDTEAAMLQTATTVEKSLKQVYEI